MKKFFLLLSVVALATLCIETTARADNQGPGNLNSMALYYLVTTPNLNGLGVFYNPNTGNFTFNSSTGGSGSGTFNGTSGEVSGTFNGQSLDGGTVTGLTSSGETLSGYFNPASGGSVPFSAVDPPAPTPEPATLMLLGAGLIGLAVAFRRKVSRNV